ncbi:MAG: molecular chaperone HtpG [Lachnospirales bacterium]
MEKGNLSINSENILPIIKKWLYSDTDIFVRELVSNASDAITKLKKLNQLGDVNLGDEDFRIDVKVDKENKKIYVEDNGIGLTAEEVKKYINDIAFSGATDFVNKLNLEGENKEDMTDIIGHFGLGFYSSFMVADVVEIESLSYEESATPIHWKCDGGIEFELEEGTRTTRGTTIVLNVSDDRLDFLESYKVSSIIEKYCGFIPNDVYFTDLNKEPEVNEDGEVVVEEEKPINNKFPLYLKNPNECTEEEYKEFYNKTFMDFNEPLFHIHLNMDYPFRLKGILYFPKLKHELESIEGQVKLYNNQVFIADNIKEVIPEYLLLLKGVIDCPDLPLNVSRSFLQNDGYVTKMSDYITKKVADKLKSIFKSEREQYNKYWDDINQFIKYGCIRDSKFYEKMEDYLVFKSTKGEYLTISEYLDNNTHKTTGTIFYTDNPNTQAQYVKMFTDNEIDVAVLETKLDGPFMSYIESNKSDVKFGRIDSEVSDVFKGDEEVENATEIEEVFKSALSDDSLSIKIENLKDEKITSMLLLSEQSRRMEEMMKMYGGSFMGMGDMPKDETLVLNGNSTIVKKLISSEDKDTQNLICKYLYDLAKISHKPLTSEEMNEFLTRSNDILTKIL